MNVSPGMNQPAAAPDFDARSALLARRAEMLELLVGLDESFADIVESAADSNLDDEHDPEGTTIAASRAQVSSIATSAREELRLVDAALHRVADGTYGNCARCGQRIACGRLEARPATTLCLTCASSR